MTATADPGRRHAPAGQATAVEAGSDRAMAATLADLWRNRSAATPQLFSRTHALHDYNGDLVTERRRIF
jgi:uncharacterized membrane-anchored protein